ncbi:MAG: hypothetical protein J0H41_08035 [Rhizobiales bacterium]|nr:hypothetical protein [Hyphomicrobiales bacterium]
MIAEADGQPEGETEQRGVMQLRGDAAIQRARGDFAKQRRLRAQHGRDLTPLSHLAQDELLIDDQGEHDGDEEIFRDQGFQRTMSV